MIYKPAEDSFFMSEVLSSYLKDKENNIKILDLGSGSGILASSCLNLGFNNITAVDIDKESINHLKNKFKTIKMIESNLFNKVKGKFNLIIFNPPYLPEDKFDNERDTTAGKKGNEIILKFLNQAKNYLENQGKILLLFSSFSNPKEILKEASKLKYKSKLISSKKLFFEELFIYEFF